MKFLNPKTWPLFLPIPKEHYDHTKQILSSQLFWNVRIALPGVIVTVILYYYLLSTKIRLEPQIVWIALQAAAAAVVLFFYVFGENWITSTKWRLRAASISALFFAGLLGIGFPGQVAAIQTGFTLATILSMIVAMTATAAFTFTMSPNTFVMFSIPLLVPIILWSWSSSGDVAGQILALMAIPFLIVLYFMTLREYRRRVNLILAEIHLKREQARSESLLLNILPTQIATELKENGAAKPVRVDNATVMFTDFVGFTRISEKLSPEAVVDELDKCFSYFDQVTEKYGLEKLKTIGDSFMCAGGLPTANRTHAVDCCLAALEIQAFMSQMKEIKYQQGLDYWELRLGINTGPLVAGVVGQKKFAYDVWGDTVNTASRLESSGIPGKINISLTTFGLVKDIFNCEHRGQIEAKNKGNIDMYFLNGIGRDMSIGGEGRVPNALFKERYAALQGIAARS